MLLTRPLFFSIVRLHSCWFRWRSIFAFISEVERRRNVRVLALARVRNTVVYVRRFHPGIYDHLQRSREFTGSVYAAANADRVPQICMTSRRAAVLPPAPTISRVWIATAFGQP